MSLMVVKLGDTIGSARGGGSCGGSERPGALLARGAGGPLEDQSAQGVVSARGAGSCGGSERPEALSQARGVRVPLMDRRECEEFFFSREVQGKTIEI